MDPRRERALIFKQFDRYQRDEGGTLVWFKFDIDESSYDSTYDEGGQAYHTGKIVPYLWLDEIEASKMVRDTSQRPMERLRAAFSVKTLDEAGIGGHEATGDRRRDPRPEKPWRDSRLNDLLYYRDRWWEVTEFNIRDKVKESSTIVGVGAVETQPEDERVWSLFPAGYAYQG